MTTLLREARRERELRSPPPPPPRRRDSIPALWLGLIRIRRQSRRSGFGWDVKERWFLRGLIQIVTYPAPHFAHGDAMFCPAVPEAGTRSRFVLLPAGAKPSRLLRAAGTGLALLVLIGCGSSLPATQASPASSTRYATTTPGDVCMAGADVLCAINPAVTQSTIRQTICRRGWTSTIRPAVSYTDNLKRAQMAQLSLPGSPADYEEDHRLALELGGAPRDERNLSPEPRPSAATKDADESSTRQLVCSGKVSLAAAQVQFIAKWLGPWPAYKS